MLRKAVLAGRVAFFLAAASRADYDDDDAQIERYCQRTRLPVGFDSLGADHACQPFRSTQQTAEQGDSGCWLPPGRAGWDNMPELARTASLIRGVVPEELFEQLGNKEPVVRKVAYRKLLAKMPEFMRDRGAQGVIGRFVVDCHALEPVDENVVPIREW